MRAYFILSYVINIVLSVVAFYVLPERVAIHFGPGGHPDNWASGTTHALIMLTANTALFLLFNYAVPMVRKIPARWISLPNSEYWFKAENISEMESRLSPRMWQMGALTLLFMFCVGLFSVHANLSDPVRLREGLFIGALVIYLLLVTCWCVLLIRDFRIPAHDNN
ncbi:MAG: DUF1648 domain-containing protein [candidate division KSB1 bacterium]|jgi:uncharacterized membrane protein|nr:DUF1648 domain-containing protein [candidate division KSB1 bacterium]